MRTYELISDEKIKKVHGNANFGTMSQREVVHDGIRKVAIGQSCGHTQYEILREHKLITAPKRGRFWSIRLTEFGMRYARAMNVEGEFFPPRFC